MCPQRQLALEELEPRNLLSGASSFTTFLARWGTDTTAAVPSSSPAAGTIAEPAVQPGSAGAQSGLAWSARQYLGSSLSAQGVSSRWDWLAQSAWYVPPENLLAYSTPADLSDPTPVADQTLWFINQSIGGRIAGEAVVKLSTNRAAVPMDFSGVVTEGGQIRIEFTQGHGQPPTTGIGQMRLLDGGWRMEMQMASGSDSIFTHWAYMSQLPSGTTPPDPSGIAPQGSLLSDEWRWLEGIRWALADTAMFGNAKAGVFAIDSFRNGYFWGSGTSSQPMHVLGSVTPEGNLLLMVSVAGAQASVRTGILRQTASGGTMTLRTYEGTPAVGSAWMLPNSDVSQGASALSARSFLASALLRVRGV